MENSGYELKKVYTIAGKPVISEIVKDEDTPRFRAFHLRTSCESNRWGTRTVGYSLTCNKEANGEDALAILERYRLKQAERIIQIESGEVPETIPSFLGVQIQGPSGKSINVIAQPDLSVSPTLLSGELIQSLALPQLTRTMFQEHIISEQLFKATIKSGALTIETMIAPSEHGSPACILGGDFFQKAVKGKEILIQEMILPDDRRALANAARCKKKHALILGKYGEHRPRLDRIRAALASLGFVGMILDEYPDIEEQSLAEKLVTYASICRFVVVDDFAPSSHIYELGICEERKFVTTILRLKGRAAARMQANITDKNAAFMRGFDYAPDSELETVVVQAAQWADGVVSAEVLKLNRDYAEWRGPNKIM